MPKAQKIDRVDFLELLWSLTSLEVRSELLGGYKDALDEDELGLQYAGDLEERAYLSMLDNCADSAEVTSDHIGTLMRYLIGQ